MNDLDRAVIVCAFLVILVLFLILFSLIADLNDKVKRLSR